MSMISGSWLGDFITMNFYSPDDFIIFIYFLIGLSITAIAIFFMQKETVKYKKASLLFCIGISIVPLQIFTEKFMLYFLEESLEVILSLTFMLSMYILLRNVQDENCNISSES